MEDLRRTATDINSSFCSARKEHILTRLRQLRPGQTGALNAVQNDDGEIVTEPEAIARALQAHWSNVLHGQPIDRNLLKRWLDSLLNLPLEQNTRPGNGQPPNSTFATTRQRRNNHSRHTASRERLEVLDWSIGRQDIEKAIQQSGKAAPGPDQLPYCVWKKLGDIGVDILWSSARALGRDDAEQLLRSAYFDTSEEGRHDFNLGKLVCLPKKPAGCDDALGDYFTPDGTRPLSIVNSDNRIIASAARLKWESLLAPGVSQAQQGFLQGRSILANLIDIDTESMTISLRSERGAIILFDFRAAFPSVSQDYVHQVLEYIGMPEAPRRLILSLYDDSKCVISCKGTTFPGFSMTAGVRQGCPLSPLLFAVTADILLRALARDLPHAMTRAYADDTAMATPDFWADAPKLRRTFQEYERI